MANSIGSTSIYQIAQRAGVSPATVSRVLNGRDGIGDETRQRVMDAARAAKYRPKQSARQVTVGLIVDQPPRQAVGSLVQRLNMDVAMHLARLNLAVHTYGSGNLESLGDRYIDAALAIAWKPETLEALQELSSVPTVVFNRPELEQHSGVIMDPVQGGRLAAEHLWARGHRKLGFLSDQTISVHMDYLTGFRQVIKDNGGEFDDRYTARTQMHSPLGPLKRLIDSGVTAIFMPSEELTHEVPYLCREGLGISLPDDLSLIGMSNDLGLQFFCPAMSVLHRPTEKMAEQAGKLLLRVIEQHDTTPHRIMLDHELVPRESVAFRNAS